MMNLTYLALTMMHRDKRTILNAIMLLLCFCGINLIMILDKMAGVAKELSTAPYLDKLMDIFSLLVVIMLIATVVILFLLMLGTLKDNLAFYRLQKYVGYSNCNIVYINCFQLFLTSIISYAISIAGSKLIITLLAEPISARIVDISYISGSIFTETFLFTFVLLISACLTLILPAFIIVRKIIEKSNLNEAGY